MYARLGLGLLERDLADTCRFGIWESTVSCICESWMHLLHVCLEQEPLINKEQVVDFMPAIFKAKYLDVVIIDFTEIKCI